jgi:hypothetical protein
MAKRFLRVILERETLSEKLLKVVDDYEIFATLIGQDFEIGEALHSPIRSSDDFPSFAVFIPTRTERKLRPEELWFKDLADGRFGDVFKFVKYYALHHFGEELETRYQVIKFIDAQLQLQLFTNNNIKKTAVKRNYDKEKLTKDISYKSRSFTPSDLEYWNKLDLTEEDLKYFNVKSVRYLLNLDGTVRKEFKKRELAFIYKIWDKLKLYQPQAPKSFKFRNTCPGDNYQYYQGFEQLSGKPEILIITKSFKDLMVFWKRFNYSLKIPVDVIAPHAESINLSTKFVNGVKENYKKIICVSDFDLAGVKFANQCKRYGFKTIFVDTDRKLINGKLKVVDKDISDYLTHHGLSKTEKLLKSWEIDQ